MTTTIPLTEDERRALIELVLSEASQVTGGLDTASLDRVAVVRAAHARLAELVRLLDDLQHPDVPATVAVRDLADAVRRDAIEAAVGLGEGDARIHHDRAAHAEAVLQRLDEPREG
jgi:hypothetical protein